ncbi:MAG: DNA cytosine methyltransferase [Pirellulaceae bacterium]
MSRKPRAIDLFCGAGGLTTGLVQAGFEVIGAVENDSLASRAYRLNHSGVAIWKKDIRHVTAKGMMRELGLAAGELDLLAACPPCQGFSTMRTKNGTTWTRDSRNDLIFEVLRMVRVMRPKTVMLENVPGLAKNQRFFAFCKTLRSLGYAVKSAVLNTMNFAVPQSRRRLVLLASRVGSPQFAEPAKERLTVRQAIGELESPTASKDPLHNYDVVRSSKVVDLIRLIPRNGGSRTALGRKSQLRCHKKIKGFWDVYGRMAWNKASPTITGGCINPSKGRFLHPQANRAITLREAALLQTFPQEYQFPLDRGRYHVALLIGNALPPEFIRRHALALKATLK